MREGEAAGGHKGSCLTCPFNAAFVEEAARVENFGCLPTAGEIVTMKRESGQNWACHDDESRVCAGLCATAKKEGLDLSRGGLISYRSWYHNGQAAALEEARRSATSEKEPEMAGVITHARITEMPKQLGDPMPIVKVKVDGGEEVDLFTYYPDELSFTPGEFIGLSLEAGRRLHYTKDVAYLRS